MKLTICILGFLLFASPAFAQQVNLSWDANTESDLAGYRVYRSTQSGSFPVSSLVSGTALVPVSQAPTFTDGTVQLGQTYFYVVSAVNKLGQESLMSNQVTAVIPAPPSAPRNLRPTVTLSLNIDGQQVAQGESPLKYTLTIPRVTPPRVVERSIEVIAH